MKRLLMTLALLVVAGCALEPANSGPRAPGLSVPPPSTAFTQNGQGQASSNGRLSLATGDLAGAEAGFEKDLTVNPFDAASLNNLAVAKTEAGQFHEALALLERAARLAPQNTEVAANLARLRNWNQNYAMQDGSTLGEAGSAPKVTNQNLPPEPPALWNPLPAAVAY